MANNKITILFILGVILLTCILTGQFQVNAQMNTKKIGEEGVLQPIAEAQAEKAGELAEGMAAGAPPAEGGGEEGEVPVTTTPEVPELSDDSLRDAIAAVAGYKMFADRATSMVRQYVRKINVVQWTETPEFLPGEEPWKSVKGEARYSPFDTTVGPPPPPPPPLTISPPFLPPVKRTVGAPIRDLILQLVKLRMVSESGGELVALADVAGVSTQLKRGQEIPIPPIPPYDELYDLIRVDDISMNSVLFVIGNESVRVAFGQSGLGTEEQGFYIEVTQ